MPGTPPISAQIHFLMHPPHSCPFPSRGEVHDGGPPREIGSPTTKVAGTRRLTIGKRNKQTNSSGQVIPRHCAIIRLFLLSRNMRHSYD